LLTLAYIHTYCEHKLTTWSRCHTQLVNKFSAFYETKMFIVSTKASHPSLSCARRILPSYFHMIRFNIILPCKPRSSDYILPSGSPLKILYAFLISPMTHPSHSLTF
jgi:hypothetical protein